jgi:hypothetical protein
LLARRVCSPHVFSLGAGSYFPETVRERRDHRQKVRKRRARDKKLGKCMIGILLTYRARRRPP